MPGITYTNMRTKKNKNGTYSITGLTSDMFSVLSRIMNSANDRCFDEQEADGSYYSNDDFVVVLTSDERESLSEMCKNF